MLFARCLCLKLECGPVVVFVIVHFSTVWLVAARVELWKEEENKSLYSSCCCHCINKQKKAQVYGKMLRKIRK